MVMVGELVLTKIQLHVVRCYLFLHNYLIHHIILAFNHLIQHLDQSESNHVEQTGVAGFKNVSFFCPVDVVN